MSRYEKSKEHVLILQFYKLPSAIIAQSFAYKGGSRTIKTVQIWLIGHGLFFRHKLVLVTEFAWLQVQGAAFLTGTLQKRQSMENLGQVNLR